MLRVVRNTLGQVAAVELKLGETPLWVPLPWNPVTREFEPQSERDDEWLAIAQSMPEWIEVDLSDHPIAPAPPAPDWELFRVRCAIAALPITGHSAKTSALNSLLTVLLSRIDKEPEILPQVAQIWDSMCAIAKPSANVVQLINGLCQACNMVFRLDGAGNMIDLQGRLI